MVVKARLQGKAGDYRFQGVVWEVGSFAYRAAVQLIPVSFRPELSRSVLSADGMTMQEVLSAAKARVNLQSARLWKCSNSRSPARGAFRVGTSRSVDAVLL